ncbi:hypothetical protein MYX77_02555 [Acidobacteriia bacterium AH_259_A11_L15]|nr:hypothetical protein [Acidobacteriia bacterium AH_259_A11_L15]
MPNPAENEPGGTLSSDHPPPSGQPAANHGRRSRSLFQRIGARRPSAGERRLWIVQGIIILGAVLLLGALMFWALS